MKQTTIYIENERLDLFKDENIVINSSVQNINDISKVFTDYSQSFTVPASQNNNRIFRHYYNASIVNGFDARVKRTAKIEISSIPFKEGKIRLEGVTVKNGKPESYKITFFGNLVSLTDLFGDDILKDVDFSQYNHLYNADTLRIAFDNDDYGGVTNTGIFFKALVYTAISPKRRFLYNANAGDTTDTETVLNIASQPIKIQDVTLAMRVRDIFNKIETVYGIDFSDELINGTGIFYNLYMTLGNSKDGVVLRSANDVKLTSSSTTQYHQQVDYDGAHEGQSYISHFTKVTPSAGYENVTYTITARDITNNISTSKTITGNGSHGTGIDWEDVPTIPYERDIEFYINADAPFQFTAETWITLERYIEVMPPNLTRSYTTTKLNDVDQTSITVRAIISDNMPDMKVKDFVTGIINAFNLVVIPTSDTSYYVDTLNNWYADGNEYDITKYVSIENVDISNQEYLNEINFEYEEPKTFLQQQFKTQNNRYYGNLQHIVTDGSGEKVDGQEYSIKLPFEQMIYERLYDADSSDLTNFQYGYKVDEEEEPTDAKPILFFNTETRLGDYTIQIDNGSGGTTEVNECNVPYIYERRYSNFSSNQSLTFGIETDTYTGYLFEKTLYNNYYEDYITDIFSAQRRLYKYTAKLPEYLLTKLQLNDKVIISGTRYIINNMEINLTTNITQLELLNDIY
ncbi:hypothetical protein [Galbibacter pacificus]|uniref:Uncharacterized protein n=1 Tax=Galbibacter pacificus TaxID=2996052 RepID=A0ABT6FQD5_9FLAO|nr:hypothetical protein [Galbibacter pacificus]MDG3582046.1 hypothetical protein [Galbibacter pacificus]MDG3585480.1 hypothetical protein [Galbibacter pacificus]